MVDIPRFLTEKGVLSVLLDGSDSLPLAMFSKHGEPWRSSEVDEEAVEIPINAFLYQAEGRNVLIDGGGLGLSPRLGGMDALLAGLGISPEQIDTVFCTHLHPDHVGGLLKDGAPAFSRATLRLHPDEGAFWRNPEIGETADEEFKAVIDGACAVLAAYAGRTETFSDGEEIAPGAVAVHLPGHTPGHSGLRFSVPDADLLLWADIVHASEMQLADPDISIVFDVDPAMAVATRNRVLAEVADSPIRVGGGHLPGIGHIRRRPQGFAFEALPGFQGL